MGKLYGLRLCKLFHVEHGTEFKIASFECPNTNPALAPPPETP